MPRSLTQSVDVPCQFPLSAACSCVATKPPVLHCHPNVPKTAQIHPQTHSHPPTRWHRSCALWCVFRHFGNQSTNATTRLPTAFSLLGSISCGAFPFFLVGFSVTYVAGRWNWLSTWQLVGWQKSFRCNFSCSCISSWTSWQMLCSIIDAHWKFQGRVPKVLELITLLNATLYVALPWKIYQYFWWCS